jgi:hypothetical protein
MASSCLSFRPEDGNEHLFMTVNRNDFSSSPSMTTQVFILSTHVAFTFHRCYLGGQPIIIIFMYRWS